MNEGSNWLTFAREDLRVAELAMQDRLYNQVCFHSQQCVEKLLKGWLAAQDKDIPRTHKMSDLLNVLPNELLHGLSSRILLMDLFYIPTRVTVHTAKSDFSRKGKTGVPINCTNF